MKKNLPGLIVQIGILLFLFFSKTGNAQSWELNGNINSGLFFFGGESAEKNTIYVGRLNTPYGKRGGLSWGVSADLKRVSKTDFLYGLNLGFEVLRSRIKVTEDRLYDDVFSEINESAYLNNSFVNTYPYFGKRFKLPNSELDLTAGFDIAYLLSSKEKIDFDVIGGRSDHPIDRKNINVDLRPRIQLAFNYNRMGIYTGYSHGLVNYTPKMDGANNQIYSRMFRFGLTYKIASAMK